MQLSSMRFVLTIAATLATPLGARADSHVVEGGLQITSASARDDLLVPLYLKLPFRPLAGQMLVVARRP